LGYRPKPLEAVGVGLPQKLREHTEVLAKNAHDTWAQLHFMEGWRYGPHVDDVKKEHPFLVPYEELPESAKQYDRHVAIQTVKALLALGYRIEGGDGSSG
jgi:hypothetical protein